MVIKKRMMIVKETFKLIFAVLSITNLCNGLALENTRYSLKNRLSTGRIYEGDSVIVACNFIDA